MSEPTTTTPPSEPTTESEEAAAHPVAEPKLDVRPPWTVDELAEGETPTELPKELVGAYLHG